MPALRQVPQHARAHPQAEASAPRRTHVTSPQHAETYDASDHVMNNETIARAFDTFSDLLARQGANPFRVEAYRRGARTVRQLERPVQDIYEKEGHAGLEALPGIGETLARGIVSLLIDGQLPQLQRAQGESDPEALLTRVPGIGASLAKRIHDTLHVDSLEDLEQAAYDGRLAMVDGMGPRRIETIRATLAQRLGRRARRFQEISQAAPSVPELLDVDREYREKAAREELPRIAPRRMNPTGASWLPILHTQRGGRSYTALFSNTPRAHEAGKTRDWVVIYPEYPGSQGPYTVVTETSGQMKGQRVVRGREHLPHREVAS